MVLSLVSIIIPCHNYGKYLEESIMSALTQTHPRTEIIVVDDESTDNTLEVTERYVSFGVKYFRIEHQGAKTPAHAHNFGLKVSTGEFIIFLGADDKLAQTYVERCLKEYYNRDKVGFVWTGCQEFGNSNLIRKPRCHILRGSLSGYLNPGGQLGAMLVPRSIYETVGGYDETLSGREDWDWIIRCLKQGFIGVSVRELLHHARLHGENLTTRANNDLFKRYFGLQFFVDVQRFSRALVHPSILKRKMKRYIGNVKNL